LKALRPGEATTLALSFLYFLLLLAAYYILRPVRDGLVAGLGTDQVKFLSVVVLITMLGVAPIFGALMVRVPRYKLLPAIYVFAILNLLLFAFAFTLPNLIALSTRVFYVWVTVFNMFVVSVFWSFMADIWNEEQGRRLFGFIAAGGSLGGLIGPTVAQLLAATMGNSGLTLVAAGLLSSAMACLVVLGNRLRTRALAAATATEIAQPKVTAQPFTGSSWQGFILVLRSPFLLGIALLVLVGAIAAMFMYIEIGRLAKELISTPAARTELFARIDFWTNVVTLVFQGVVVGLLTSRFGIRAPLLGMAVIGCISFIPVALSPALATIAITNVARRASEYGLGKPGRDMLYTVATPQEKYLAKNVIDTVVYRGADVLGSWTHTALIAVGVTLAGLGWIASAGMAATVFVALAVARGYELRRSRQTVEQSAIIEGLPVAKVL
jgi:AAA family ATP:ADP antiporter